MELLPAAERNRRALVAGAVLGLLAVQACWPAGRLERLVGLVVAPVQAVLAPAAALLLGPVEAAPEPEPPPVAGLAAVEEGLGMPPEVPGTVWWPVPVLERGETTWLLGAGTRHGLFEGQPVVFGRAWLGRLEKVEPDRARLRLWTSPEAPTGARIGSGPGIEAICLGRRRGGEPLVRRLAPGAEPEDGMPVFWRHREGDAPWYEQGGFRLGVLRRRGDERRREGYWAVEPELPAAAEGRVFVGLGAVPADPPAERSPERVAAELLLAGDGVYGPGPRAVRSAVGRLPEPASAVTAGGRVAGVVVAVCGPVAWTVPVPPADWPGELVAVEPGPPTRLFAGREARSRAGALLFTRGGARFPRGLWLGRSGEPARPPDRELEVVGR
ncbi:MAG: hypothetical protein D6702_13045 [Planctomycetota bacterium]|nr:MAG: hypothetical protein D6702_13045 [Planctomycetota bacterium]